MAGYFFGESLGAFRQRAGHCAANGFDGHGLGNECDAAQRAQIRASGVRHIEHIEDFLFAVFGDSD